MQLISEAKQYLKENWDEGCECPVCKQLVKKYSRAITSSMAYVLILIYQHSTKHIEKYIHVEKFLYHSDVLTSSLRADFHKLRFWGLLEPKNEKRDDGSDRNGYWAITEKGIDFVENRIKIFSHFILYNNQLLGFDGDKITIQESLKKKFNYAELMKEYSYNETDDYKISDTNEQLKLF
jgi:hypothetical protein